VTVHFSTSYENQLNYN